MAPGDLLQVSPTGALPFHPPVLDRDRVPIGRVRSARADALVVELSRAARDRLGVPGFELVVPRRMVARLRADELLLDRDLDALRRMGVLAPARLLPPLPHAA
jgi:hypothetical protein